MASSFRTYAPTKLSENMMETPEGFLLCKDVRIARTGMMEYGPKETPLEVGKDGRVQIFRDAKEVFRPETIASFEGKPITIEHPTDFVDPKNWKELAKGLLQNVRKGDQDEDGETSLIADILVTDAAAIKLIRDGMREVSCGYEAEYEQTGDGKGTQSNIIGNHLALVSQGRAGSSYSINDSLNFNKGTKLMSKKLVDGLKQLFGAKAVDEAMAEPKEEMKEKTGDELMMKDVKDLMQRIEGFMKNGEADGGGKGINKEDKATAAGKMASGDEESEEKPEAEKKPEAKDDEPPKMSLEDRLSALEALCAKLAKGHSEDEDMEGEEASDEGEEGDESEDADEEEKEESKDASAEGEEGEQSQKKSKRFGDAALKKSLAGTKDAQVDAFDKGEFMTAEKMNQINAAHWASRKGNN